MDDMCVHESKQTSLAPLAANTRLLVSTKDGLRRRLLPRVDEDGPSFEPACHLAGLLDILTPHTGTETSLGIVGTGNDLFQVRPRLRGHNGAKRLLGNDAGVVGRVINNGRLDEEALSGSDVGLANCELVALLLAVCKEGLDLLVLHGVLDGAKQVVAVIWVAHLDRLGEGNHLSEEVLVDGLVDVDTLGSDADLARVLEGTHYDFGCHFLDIDVRENDGSVVSAQLECHALERLCGGFHHLLSCCNRSRERNLGDVGVLAHELSELVVSAYGLNETSREDLLHEFDNLEAGVGGEGATSYQSRALVRNTCRLTKA